MVAGLSAANAMAAAEPSKRTAADAIKSAECVRAAVNLKLAFAHRHRSRMATIPPGYGSERAAAVVAALINLLAIGTKFRHATSHSVG